MEESSPNPLMAAVNKLVAAREDSCATRESDETRVRPPAPPSGAALTGQALLADPDSVLQAFRGAGGTDREVVEWYAQATSPVHLLRSGAQPAMLKASLKTLAPALARELCSEAGVTGTSAQLLAEQAAESRCDEAYARMLAGIELDQGEIAKAERLLLMAERHSRRMMKALDQLHRLNRPKVTVRVEKVANLNLGTQEVSTPGERSK